MKRIGQPAWAFKNIFKWLFSEFQDIKVNITRSRMDSLWNLTGIYDYYSRTQKISKMRTNDVMYDAATPAHLCHCLVSAGNRHWSSDIRVVHW